MRGSLPLEAKGQGVSEAPHPARAGCYSLFGLVLLITMVNDLPLIQVLEAWSPVYRNLKRVGHSGSFLAFRVRRVIRAWSLHPPHFQTMM